MSGKPRYSPAVAAERKRQSRQERFHLGDILSITHERLVSPRHMDGIYDILNFLTQDELFTHQLPRSARECRPALLEQHPQLKEIPSVSDEEATRLKHGKPVQWWESWLETQVAKYGEYLFVEPMPKGIHEYRNPIEEAVDMVGKDRVIVLKKKD